MKNIYYSIRVLRKSIISTDTINYIDNSSVKRNAENKNTLLPYLHIFLFFFFYTLYDKLLYFLVLP